jgi:SAM-dependent methyltransferase
MFRTELDSTAYVPNVTADEHRGALIRKLLENHADAPAAYKLIGEQIDAMPNAHDRWHVRMNEVRHLYTFLLTPAGPGLLLTVYDLCSPVLASLKNWQIDDLHARLNLENEPIPYADESVDGMLLCEVIEHYNADPLFSLIEINRVLKPGGFLVLSTPNAASWYQILRALQHLQPSRFAVYSVTEGQRLNHIHAREYVVPEIATILKVAGFSIESLTTMDYGALPPFVPVPGFSAENRGETIFCVARKSGPPAKRYLSPIYVVDKDFSG